MNRGLMLGVFALLAAICFSLVPTEDAQAGWRHRRCGGWRCGGWGHRAAGCCGVQQSAGCCGNQYDNGCGMSGGGCGTVAQGCCDVSGGAVYMEGGEGHAAPPPAPAPNGGQVPPAPQADQSAPPPAPAPEA